MRREPTFEAFESDDEPERPLARPRPFSRAQLAAKIVLAAAVVTGLTIAAKGTMQPAPVAGSWADPPAAASASLARAAVATPSGTPLLKLELAEGEPASRAEPPRWSPATGLREDALSAGRFDAIEAPFLRITLTETGPDADPPASLFVTLARRAAEVQGLSVLRTGLRGQIETKFGLFEIVETSLSGHGARACAGFRSLGETRMRVDGWLCGLLGQAPEAKAVACALDRLVLTGRAGETLEAAFAEAEARRGAACGTAEAARPPRAEATGSIGKPRPRAKLEQNGRSRRNEAQMRQIVQAGQ